MSCSEISTPLRIPLSEITFFPVGVSSLRTVNFKSIISFSIVSILWSMSTVLFAVAYSMIFISFSAQNCSPCRIYSPSLICGQNGPKSLPPEHSRMFMDCNSFTLTFRPSRSSRSKAPLRCAPRACRQRAKCRLSSFQGACLFRFHGLVFNLIVTRAGSMRFYQGKLV
jgi:hypothetical protein